MNKLVALMPMQGVQAQGRAIDGAFDTYYKAQGNQRQNALLDIQQAQNERAAQTHEQTQELVQGQMAYKLLKGIEGADEDLAQRFIDQNWSLFENNGFDADDRLELKSPERRQAVGKALESMFSDPSNLDAATKGFNSMIAGMSPEDQDRARRIELGLEAREGSLSSKERIAASEETTEAVASSEATIAGAKETAKLDSQLELKPKIQAAVTEAVEAVKTDVANTERKRSNASTLQVYETAMNGLVSALGGTTTGPGASWVTLTADQQIAEGAISAMAPVLKQLFRGAGEGTFTDKDQELLLGMVPTRKDHPEAIRAKLENIDSIVRAKLGVEPESNKYSVGQIIEAGGKKYRVTGGDLSDPDVELVE